MKKLSLVLLAMVVLCISSCSLVGDIFKAGYYVGIIVVIIVLVIIFWLVSLFKGRGN